MKIALINASPKRKKSASDVLLDDLNYEFPAKHETKEFYIDKPFLTEDEISELLTYSAWVFAHPLHVDSTPSHLLSCLCQMERELSTDKTIHVYAIVNGGFYEGRQSHHALAIMENWCKRAGLQWGMGIGYGGGSSIVYMRGIPVGRGPKSTLGKAYEVLVKTILSQGSEENIYTSIGLPRIIYKFLGEIIWRKQLITNGCRMRDINRRV
ncbi:MAG: NAD(P)H-dependent oxidoreductase [Oscillospiraceae bacterium]|nr:NAD(P)H-dependent oxidoreductase [Oscillospiraceae bacterium]